jgi:hypothetical protein
MKNIFRVRWRSVPGRFVPRMIHPLGRSVPWTIPALDDLSLGWSVPWTICPLDDLSLGRSVPWTIGPPGSIHPLDDPSLGQSVPWTIRPLDNPSLLRSIPWTTLPLDDAALGHNIPNKNCDTMSRFSETDNSSPILNYVIFSSDNMSLIFNFVQTYCATVLLYKLFYCGKTSLIFWNMDHFPSNVQT